MDCIAMCIVAVYCHVVQYFEGMTDPNDALLESDSSFQELPALPWDLTQLKCVILFQYHFGSSRSLQFDYYPSACQPSVYSCCEGHLEESHTSASANWESYPVNLFTFLSSFKLLSS